MANGHPPSFSLSLFLDRPLFHRLYCSAYLSLLHCNLPHDLHLIGPFSIFIIVNILLLQELSSRPGFFFYEFVESTLQTV